MKELLLKIAGVQTEQAFYKKFPDQKSFFKAHPEAKEIIAQYQQQEMMANAPENSQEQMMGTEEEMVEQMAMGGMIKRKDGSYSKPGLWDNIRKNKGSGKKPTKQMLEQAKKIQAEEMMYGGMVDSYYNGGGINNPGFKALPKAVQENIISNMSMGGEVEEYKNGGYTVRKSNDRKGKTHVVTGPDGTKEYFGDPKMGERSKSKYGKEAFYARHKTNLKNNPFFRAYARSTWADGGILPEVEQLMLAGQNPYNMGGYVEYPTKYFLGGLLDGPKGAPQDFQNNSMYPMNYPGGGMVGSDMIDYQADYNYPTMYPGGGMIAGPMMGYEEDDFMYAMGGGININPANEGKFTEWAAKRGMTVQEAANKVMTNRSKYTADVVKMANFAKNAAGWKKAMGGRIYQEGGMLNSMTEGIPVQTETFEGQAEQVALPDGTIKSVEATTSHENMGDDTVTDLLPGGSHIQSARNQLTPDQYVQLMQMFKPESAEQDIKKLAQVYQSKYGKKNGKKLSPADISEYAKNKYQNKSTPNSFDTDKLKEGNKKSYLDLSMQMNDLIKSGKELAEGVMLEEQMMAYGGMVNKYPWGTDANGVAVWIPGGEDPLTRNILQEEGNLPTIPNDLAQAMKAGYLKYDPSIKKYRANLPKDMAYKEKIRLGQAIERMGLQNVRQSKTPGYDNFYGGNTPYDYARFFVENTTGKPYNDNVTEKQVVKDYFELLGTTPSEEDLKNPASLFKIPGFDKAYQAYVTQTPGMRESFGVPTLGDTPSILGMQQWKARPLKAQETPEAAAVVEETPAQKAEQQMLSANTPIAPAARVPMQNRFNFGLLEGQLGRGLSANQAALEAGLSLDPLYIMETPDTYIRSRKNEIPVGNILYNIERAQRNTANALAGQTGDWSTLASNISNAGAQAMNQVGDTLSKLNQTNVALYNETQGLQQDLLGSNMGVRNQNLTNMQNMLNFKRNLLGQKAVKDSEIYSEYSKSMGENAQKEQNQKLEMLNIMASKPDMFKGEQGQMFVNQILGNTGTYNNPLAGTLLDNILSANRYNR
jgi:hypothetical protein